MNPILAYVDAGTGSLVIQLVAGGLAGLAAFLKFRWTSIRQRFRKDRHPSRSAATDE